MLEIMLYEEVWKFESGKVWIFEMENGRNPAHIFLLNILFV